MAVTLRIKRRVGGGTGGPSPMANAELAYNEVDHILYYGEGTGGSGGSATKAQPVGGPGLFSNSTPIMNSGTPTAGNVDFWSRGNHVHPSDTSKADLANPTFTGVVTISGTITGAGMVAWAAAPPAIGSTTAANGSFALLQAATVTAVGGFVGLMASPGPIGSTAASTGAFTNLTVGGTLSGAGVTGALTAYAKIDSQAFTGTPSLPTGATAITQANTVAAGTSLATTAYVRQTRLDQLTAPTATVSMNSQILSDVQQGPKGTDVATRAYVDANSAGLVSHTAAAAATTANITLSAPQTIDGYAAVAGDRILVKNQTIPANNGIYVVAAGAWTRAADMDAWTEVPQAYVFVSNGTANAASSWVCNSLPGGLLGTTDIVWVQFSQQAQVIDGAGLLRVGNTFNVLGTLNRILVSSDSIDIDPTNYAGQASITILGTVATGVWNATGITVSKGGTGASTLTGYVKGTGTAALTGVATIPTSDITGLKSMAFQDSTLVAITGGTIDNIILDGGKFPGDP